MTNYPVIILEQSSGVFLHSDNYIHHFEQKSDTGIELELLQYYDYICLDIFRKKNPRVAGELEKWLTFLTITHTDEMQQFLTENSAFQSVYDYAILMLQDRKELLNMFSDIFEDEDIVASLNKTNESVIKQLTKENDALQAQNNKMQSELISLRERIHQLEQQINKC